MKDRTVEIGRNRTRVFEYVKKRQEKKRIREKEKKIRREEEKTRREE